MLNVTSKMTTKVHNLQDVRTKRDHQAVRKADGIQIFVSQRITGLRQKAILSLGNSSKHKQE